MLGAGKKDAASEGLVVEGRKVKNKSRSLGTVRRKAGDRPRDDMGEGGADGGKMWWRALRKFAQGRQDDNGVARVDTCLGGVVCSVDDNICSQ